MRALLSAFLLFWTMTIHGQSVSLEELEHLPVFRSIEEALLKPDSVYRLRLKGRLTEIPHEVFTAFPNLTELNLSRNRLVTLPKDIGLLKHVKRLNLDRNKLEQIPSDIGDMESLQELIASRNELVALPDEIGNLKNIYLIDLWSNNISDLPHTMKGMPNLKEVDLRVIVMTDDQKETIRELLPNVKVHLDQGCNCQ